jgi:hypothetical protein
MPAVAENPSRLLASGTLDENSLETNTDPAYAERFRALQEPLKPPPRLTLKEIWQITATLVRAARQAQKSKAAAVGVSNMPSTQP